MIISYSPSTDPRRMLNFQRTDVRSLSEAQQYILKYAWSPCVWDGNIRAKSRFAFSDFCALDFDDGKWNIQDAASMLTQNNLCGFVGTTKSHGVDKGGVTCDRFRIVMPWASRITCAKTYEQNMARLVEHMPADRAAKDAARFFWACTAVVFYRPGVKLDWVPLKTALPKYRELTKHRIVPPGILTKLRATGAGNRNNMVYWTAKRLKECGLSVDEAEKVIADNIALDRVELARSVLSAFQNSQDKAPR